MAIVKGQHWPIELNHSRHGWVATGMTFGARAAAERWIARGPQPERYRVGEPKTFTRDTSIKPLRIEL